MDKDKPQSFRALLRELPTWMLDRILRHPAENFLPASAALLSFREWGGSGRG